MDTKQRSYGIGGTRLKDMPGAYRAVDIGRLYQTGPVRVESGQPGWRQ